VHQGPFGLRAQFATFVHDGGAAGLGGVRAVGREVTCGGEAVGKAAGVSVGEVRAWRAGKVQRATTMICRNIRLQTEKNE
jgi:hypothetical protein